ncbi:acyl-CoA dehydrogenase family protein [Mycobacterium sp. E796]|uniref:acyl-CoA dehydrogenase family protein n=1 Tax=Mycobacterium sp. E796 TaxID=1834151 RepID=UPI003515ECF4
MSGRASVDPAVIDMIDSVLAEHRRSRPPAALPEVAVTRDPGLWQRLEDLGLVRLTGAESAGGSGAGWYEAAELLTAAVRHGVRIPLAEHDLLACWLLEANQMPVDGALRTVCVIGEHGIASFVPWAGVADRIVVVWSAAGAFHMADIDAAELDITRGANLIGEPRDTVAVDVAALRGLPVAADLVAQLGLRSALVRSIQGCAALDQILHLSIEHATARIQFGRPLSKFQAVQNLISDIAAEAALARTATEAALNVAVTSDWSASNLDFLVAVARSCLGHATSVVVRNAHQVHGAIGTTREHRLHEYTRAALAWRSEFGSVHDWDDRLTTAAVQAGARGLWGLITG